MYGWQNEMFWLGEKIFWSWLWLFLAHISIPRGVILTIINSWKHIPISPSIHTHLTPSFQQHQSTNDHSNCPNLMILWSLSITHRDNYKVSIIIDPNHSSICTPIFWSSIHGFLIEDAQSPSTPKPIDRQSVLNAKSIVIYTEGYGNSPSGTTQNRCGQVSISMNLLTTMIQQGKFSSMRFLYIYFCFSINFIMHRTKSKSFLSTLLSSSI